MRFALLHASCAALALLAGCGRLGYRALAADTGLDSPDSPDGSVPPDAFVPPDAPALSDGGLDVAPPPDIGPDARGLDMPLEDFVDRLAALFCAASVDCVAPRDDDFTLAQCVALATSQLRSETVPLLRESERLGNFRYGGTFAEACLASFPLDACEIFATGYSFVCIQALQGLVPTGGRCDLSLECGVADVCVPDGDAVCPNGVCTPRGDIGETCERRPLFPTDEQCRRGLRCVGERCAMAVGAGEVCSGPEQCGPRLACSDGVCVEPAAAYVAALGADCQVSAGRLCAPGLSCSFAGRCTAAASSVGAACAAGLPDPCLNGQYCDGASCIDLPSEGMDCLPPDQLRRCQPFLDCAPSGRCWGYDADTRRCGADVDCGPMRRCLLGQCSDPLLCAT